jgi:hypothetical protein
MDPSLTSAKTYESWYADRSNDRASVAGTMSIFGAPTGNTALQPAAVAASFVNQAPEVSRLLLLLVSGHVHLFHEVAKFPPTLGVDTAWDNQSFAFAGDVVSGPGFLTATTVSWLSTHYHLITGTVLVAKRELAATTFAADPNLELLGPFANQDAETEVVRVRITCCLPPQYAHLLLAAPLPVRAVYELLMDRMTTDGLLEDCKPLFNWLRVAVTIPTTEEARPRVEVVAPTAPVLDAALARQG